MTTTATERAAGSARRLAALLLGSGVLHFAVPKPYDTIVPRELPGSARCYTYASGVAELIAGGLLLSPRTRRVGGLAALAVFIGVYPANLNLVRLWKGRPLAWRVAAFARLPLQIPMITTAVKVWRTA